MKNLLIFLFGAACGVGGTMLWLRKDIKKELNKMKETVNEEVPFVVDDFSKGVPQQTPEGGVSGEKRTYPYPKEVKDKYHQTVSQYNMPASEEQPASDESGDPGEGFSETDGGIYEIDEDIFMHDHEAEKVRLVYFRGDQILSEENGMIIPNPAALIGGEWESCVGHYADRTAFIRNARLVTDYEIYVEDGLHQDEYGIEYRED